MRFRVLVTGGELASEVRRRLSSIGAAVDFAPGIVDEDAFAEEIGRVPTQAVLLRGNPPLTRRVMEAASALKVIAKHGAGVDSVDLEAAADRGILVMTAGGANAPAVAELTMALLLALRREVVRLDGRVKAGRWDRGAYKAQELGGHTLGIIGFGRIGRRVARLAQAFGMRVITVARPGSVVDSAVAVETTSLDALLAESDVVSLHCPLNGTTRHLLNSERLARMKPGALLINTARGELIDEPALAAALSEQRLSGAALDTLSTEPPRPGNPLLSAPNVVLTPHVAAQTIEATERTGIQAAENIVAVLTGGSIETDYVAIRAVLRR